MQRRGAPGLFGAPPEGPERFRIGPGTPRPARARSVDASPEPRWQTRRRAQRSPPPDDRSLCVSAHLGISLIARMTRWNGLSPRRLLGIPSSARTAACPRRLDRHRLIPRYLSSEHTELGARSFHASPRKPALCARLVSVCSRFHLARGRLGQIDRLGPAQLQNHSVLPITISR